MLEWKKYKSLEELREMYGDTLDKRLYAALIQYSEENDRLKTEIKSKIELILDEFTTKLNNILEKKEDE